MIAFSDASESNLHLQRLQEVCLQTNVPISWVVFADDDPVMLRRLAGALQRESAVILPIPQALWEADGDLLKDAILWLIKERRIANLALVGNSAAGVPVSDPFVTGQSAPRETTEELFTQVQRAQRLKAQVENHFARQIHSLLAVPEIDLAVDGGVLRMHALYYRDESGVFAAYDPLTSSFRVLVR
ncbi:hypothetical protein [Botrimarina mediterranea]|uniref:Uncharacterized protein n=1 Tax=Botrimarina mediterranea TaxID=2528022 RepID=A0A518KCP7_9BACT|nr:hypothetical protein [Botrimarina mediterranea]QDV75570.1 hypothetical protein Spa11_37890 [Botrimarina mediterranea]